MRVFVSLPVKDMTREQIRAEHDRILSGAPAYFNVPEERILDVPMIEPHQLTGQHPVYCLGINLQMLCQADVVVFHPDWKGSRACRIEHEICEQYGIPHVDLSMEFGDGGFHVEPEKRDPKHAARVDWLSK